MRVHSSVCVAMFVVAFGVGCRDERGADVQPMRSDIPAGTDASITGVAEPSAPNAVGGGPADQATNQVRDRSTIDDGVMKPNDEKAMRGSAGTKSSKGVPSNPGTPRAGATPKK